MKTYYVETGNIKWSGEAVDMEDAVSKMLLKAMEEESMVGVLATVSDIGFEKDLTQEQIDNFQYIISIVAGFQFLLERVDEESKPAIEEMINKSMECVNGLCSRIQPISNDLPELPKEIEELIK